MLKYEFGSGWEPLCKFLGKELPDEPFPHCNAAATCNNAIGAFIGKTVKHSLLNLRDVVGIAPIGYGLLRSSFK